MSDYVHGKLDWLAAGLPTEGTNSQLPRAADVSRRDVPTCALGDRLGDVQERVRAAGWNACVVVNEHSVVLGLLRERELEGEAGLTVERAMRPGPSTFRTYVAIAEMAEYMTKHDLVNAPITTANGKLVGLLLREDAQRSASDNRRSKGGER